MPFVCVFEFGEGRETLKRSDLVAGKRVAIPVAMGDTSADDPDTMAVIAGMT
jgi:hypothetical protein